VRSRASRIFRALLVAFGLALAAAALVRPVLAWRGANTIRRGQELAAAAGCWACHGGATGTELADPGSRYDTVPRLLAGDTRLYAQSRAEIVEWIRDGHPASLTSDAAAFATYRAQEIQMPAFGARLGAERVEDLADFVMAANGWMSPEDPLAARGEEIARGHCLGCHNVGGAGGLANPGSLAGTIPGLWGADFDDLVADDAELEEWILRGSSRRVARWPLARWFWTRQVVAMPSFEGRLDSEELAAVMAYVRWLGATRGGTLETAAGGGDRVAR
jgi:mono/diheme cytochrome c family protein